MPFDDQPSGSSVSESLPGSVGASARLELSLGWHVFRDDLH